MRQGGPVRPDRPFSHPSFKRAPFRASGMLSRPVRQDAVSFQLYRRAVVSDRRDRPAPSGSSAACRAGGDCRPTSPVRPQSIGEKRWQPRRRRRPTVQECTGDNDPVSRPTDCGGGGSAVVAAVTAAVADRPRASAPTEPQRARSPPPDDRATGRRAGDGDDRSDGRDGKAGARGRGRGRQGDEYWS